MCLTPEEIEVIYNCLEEEKVVSPLHFSKEIIKPEIKPEYARLDQILEEEGSVNPYEYVMLEMPKVLDEQENWLESLDSMGTLTL